MDRNALVTGRLAVLIILAAIAVVAASRWATRSPHVPADPPRTRHLHPDGTPVHTNRLANEASPYLRQHAHNPVDWYPWGEEAFAKARAERKPILLSVGYSTCHWCHVMEEESFEDLEIAAVLNARYVAIKVDREERPDVDAVYMNAVRLMSEGGGWPMTVWLTPDRRPFYAGTYFAPRAGVRGMPIGFLELLGKLADVYGSDPARAEAAAADVTTRLQAAASSRGAMPARDDAFTRAWAEIAPTFDREHGGFGGGPKFPQPSMLLFLLRQHRRTGDAAPLDMVVATLDAMAAGGIHDHVGGGFHRYAVDAGWRTPHFEKMLYDNALLPVVYVEASQATGRADLADVARTTLAYLSRDMAAPGGGFFAASDADSEGEEGRYFVWTAAELRDALGPEPARLAAAYFDVADGAPATTLATPKPLDAVAGELGLAPDEARRRLDAIRETLRTVRSRRVAPHVDRKVVTGWNGLAVSAFARAARVLDDPALAEPARDAATALLAARTDGNLPRFLMDGTPRGDAYLDDYAFLIAGLLDLHEATGDVRWLREAIALQEILDRRFADPAGGYFLTADDHETLLTREKPDYDGAEPTGNSVALLNLRRLYELTTDDRHRVRADALLEAFGARLARRPSGLTYMLAGLDFAASPVKEIVLVSPADPGLLRPFLERLDRTFLPNHVLAVIGDGAPDAALASLVPVVADKPALGGRPTAYVCERRVCKLPTTDAAVFAEQLSR